MILTQKFLRFIQKYHSGKTDLLSKLKNEGVNVKMLLDEVRSLEPYYGFTRNLGFRKLPSIEAKAEFDELYDQIENEYAFLQEEKNN